MNEKIDKLLVKAGAYFGGEGVVYDTFDPKKFAELIVLECIKQVFYTIEDEEEDNISSSIRDRIKQHFGVEE
jgi:hypothetical protein